MKTNNLLIVCALTLCSNFVLAQDTLLLINGKEWAAPSFHEENDKVFFRPARKKGKSLNPSEWVALPNAGAVHPGDLITGNLAGTSEDGTVTFKTQTGETIAKPRNDFYYLNDSLAVLAGARYLDGLVNASKENVGTLTYFPLKPERSVRKERLFSIRSGGRENVIYQQDTNSRHFFVPTEDARAYVYGRRSARNHYESTWSYLGGAASGLSGTFVHYFWAPLPMTAFSLMNFAFQPKMKPERTGPEDKPFLGNEWFVDGYRFQANQRKLRNSLMTGIPGFMVSWAIRWSYYEFIY